MLGVGRMVFIFVIKVATITYSRDCVGFVSALKVGSNGEMDLKWSH